MATIPEALAIGVQHHQAGRLQIAEQIYRQILAVDPNQADALHLLGVVASQMGQHALATQYIGRAIELNGSDCAFHSNLGNAFKAQGKLDEAIASYRRALELNPDDGGALYNLGIVTRDQGRLEEAAACFSRALVLNPGFADAHNNMGTVFHAQGKLDEAVDAFQRTLELKPDHAEARNNLGAALQAQENLEEAVACFRRAVELKPDYPEAHNNLGNALQKLGRLEESIACCRRALELRPNYAEAHCNLGNAVKDKGNLDEAAACYRRALALNPNLPEAHNNLGAAFEAQGQPDEAVASCRRALELKPDYPEAHINLGNAFKDQGDLDNAVACYHRALELKPDLPGVHSNLGTALKDQASLDDAMAGFRRALDLKPSFLAAYHNLLYTLQFSPAYDAAAIYEEHLRFNREHAEPLARDIAPHTNDADPGRRLRVGYVSPNFRSHAEAFFLAPLFSAHNHQAFEIFCYSDVVFEDEITAKLRSDSDVWRVMTGLSDERVAQAVREDKIDILVDLTMHMAHGRPLLFARKPAPVQVCWLAYQGTTGLSTMDYRLTDPHLDPPGLFDRYYSEESVRLPDSFWCYDPLASEPAVHSLPALERGYVTFGSLNNFCKVNEGVLQLWAHVMRAVDQSKLMVLAGEGSHRRRMLKFLENEGIAPERISFHRLVPRAEYLKFHHQIDIGLDTFPYNGQTTTLDAIWMGVPVVTITGQTAAARAGTSLMRNLGMPELIAESPDQFVSIAVGLANDLRRLEGLRCSLRDRLEKSRLMDAPRFARNVEAAYRSMWERWCTGRSFNS